MAAMSADAITVTAAAMSADAITVTAIHNTLTYGDSGSDTQHINLRSTRFDVAAL